MTIIHKIKQQDGLIKSLQSKLSKLATEADEIKTSREYWRDTAHRLSEEAEQLRKERDELANIIREADDSLHTLFGDEAHEIAKRIIENGNA